MEEVELKAILAEIRREQTISPYVENETIEQYIKEGIYDINENCGKKVDYKEDLRSRSLLKNYVFYVDHKRLAEFKEIYGDEYAALQAKYYTDTSIS